MNGETDFFSKKHSRLLNIATWANGLVFVVIAWFIIVGVVEFLQNFLIFQGIGSFTINSDRLAIAKSVVDLFGGVIKGLIYALILKGISLGLSMVVETDINYRENNEKGGAHE